MTIHWLSIDAIEQNYRASYQSTLKNSSRVMDMNLKNIVDVGRNFLNDEALQQILEKGMFGGPAAPIATNPMEISSRDAFKINRITIILL